MYVTTRDGNIEIDDQSYELLLDHSLVHDSPTYKTSLVDGKIAYSDLCLLAHRAHIPLPLFFAPRSVVKSQVDEKNEKVLEGRGKTTFSLNSREKLDPKKIEPLVRDLVRKQEYLKSYDPDLPDNPILGILRRTTTPARDAAKLLTALDLTFEQLHSCKSKRDALELQIAKLESKQVLIAQSDRHYMPQRLDGLRFSGITVKDRKLPYIFLNRGDHGDYQEPDGRHLFTLVLLTVLTARGIFAPVIHNNHATSVAETLEYDITSEILMSSPLVRTKDVSSLEAIKSSSSQTLVTPSAFTVRAYRLGILPHARALEYLDRLRREYESRKNPPGGPTPRPEKGVTRYNGKECSLRMLDALDTRKLSPREFCRILAFNKMRPSDIERIRSEIN